MQVAASVTLHCRAMVGYVDTCHSFSATRVSHMLGGLVGGRDAVQVCCTRPFCCMIPLGGVNALLTTNLEDA